MMLIEGKTEELISGCRLRDVGRFKENNLCRRRYKRKTPKMAVWTYAIHDGTIVEGVCVSKCGLAGGVEERLNRFTWSSFVLFVIATLWKLVSSHTIVQGRQALNLPCSVL